MQPLHPGTHWLHLTVSLTKPKNANQKQDYLFPIEPSLPSHLHSGLTYVNAHERLGHKQCIFGEVYLKLDPLNETRILTFQRSLDTCCQKHSDVQIIWKRNG